jgi:glycosyltransferase A (GT-A) superfamily protein (DUF2064 family)
MEARALLIFADSAHTDCKRRGWPARFRILLETQSFRFEERTGFDVHLFASRGSHRLVSSPLRVHLQEGVSFGQRLENAIECLSQLGYQEIVVVGCDCPDLEHADILTAFDELKDHALVLGPDHRGGCYLIGIHACDRVELRGVQWQRDTDFRALVRRFGSENTFRLAVKIDVDGWGDIHLLARSASRWDHLAGSLLRLQEANWITHHLSNKTDPMLLQRIYWQLPPPLIFSRT